MALKGTVKGRYRAVCLCDFFLHVCVHLYVFGGASFERAINQKYVSVFFLKCYCCDQTFYLSKLKLFESKVYEQCINILLMSDVIDLELDNQSIQYCLTTVVTLNENITVHLYLIPMCQRILETMRRKRYSWLDNFSPLQESALSDEFSPPPRSPPHASSGTTADSSSRSSQRYQTLSQSSDEVRGFLMQLW